MLITRRNPGGKSTANDVFLLHILQINPLYKPSLKILIGISNLSRVAQHNWRLGGPAKQTTVQTQQNDLMNLHFLSEKHGLWFQLKEASTNPSTWHEKMILMKLNPHWLLSFGPPTISDRQDCKTRLIHHNLQPDEIRLFSLNLFANLHVNLIEG